MTALFLPVLLAFDETPEKTVQGFIDAFNAHDAAAMSRRIIGQKPGAFPAGSTMPKAKLKMGKSAIQGSSATVEVDVDMSMPGEGSQSSHETVELKKVGEDWQIVPHDPRRDGMRQTQFIGMLAFLIANPQVFGMAKTAAKKTICLSNVKQVSLGTLMYSADHNDTLPKNAAQWKAAIMPYVKNEKIFHCPEDASGKVSYFLDPRVAGKTMSSIPSPSQTAMIVEGAANRAIFRHGGKTTLGYVDGHVKTSNPTAVVKARTISLK